MVTSNVAKLRTKVAVFQQCLIDHGIPVPMFDDSGVEVAEEPAEPAAAATAAGGAGEEEDADPFEDEKLELD